QREGRDRRALRQSRHRGIQPRARRQAREGGEGLPRLSRNAGRPSVDDQLRRRAAALSRGKRSLLVAQSPGAFRSPAVARTVRRRRKSSGLLALIVSVAAAACATQADVQFVRDDIQEARKQAADAKAMVESLKVDVQTL